MKDSVNSCVLLHGPESSSISHTFLSKPDLDTYPSDYVLLQISHVGVCGSDVHFYTHGGVGSDPKKYAQHYKSQSHPESDSGLVMGHEASATVLKINSSVTTLKAGDNVAIEPGIPCRRCQRCVEGSYNLCPGMRFAASFYDEDGFIRQTPGTLSRYYILPESLCFKLPEGISLAEGVMVEPLAVAVHACRMVKVSHDPGHTTVLIMGAGTIGVMTVAVACAFGAKSVILVDVVSDKLDNAKRWLTKQGSAGQIAGTKVEIYVNDREKDSKGNAREALQAVGMGGVDAVIEASGVPSATAMGIHALRPGGHMVQTGLAKNSTMDSFPITDLSEKEIHLHGAFRYNYGDFETAIDLLGRGQVGAVKDLISRIFKFEEYEDAWKATRDGDVGHGVKNMIEMNW